MQRHLIPPSSLLSFSFFFVFCNLAAPLSADADYEGYTECAPSPFRCGGKTYNISYPFGVSDRAQFCFVPDYKFSCEDNSLVLEMSSVPYVVNEIDYEKNILTIVKKEFVGNTCPHTNTTIDQYLFSYTDQVQNLTLFYGCSSTVSSLPTGFQNLPCLGNSFFTAQAVPQAPNLSTSCSVGVISIFQTAVVDIERDPSVLGDKVQEGFNVTWTAGAQWCAKCQNSGGRCGYNESAYFEPTCFCKGGSFLTSCSSGTNDDAKAPSNGNGKIRTRNRKIAIGVGAGVGGSIITCLIFLICFRYCKKRSADSPILLSLATSTNAFSSSNAYSSHPSSTSEFGKSTSLLPTHIYSYEELEEATNHFNPSKELGDGGFGTVYHGKLRDGRHVAVKRLYENNYRRVEQFMNEIDILSRLRHPNLVSLYGCTSRHSRELLLVYEYIPNGTIADHLHGNRTKNGSLKWPVRMSIAIETADALAYLHAVDIIHRDVKSNNILLDNNFRVKVADFGLSRLFPIDKTHVSTAPQGTPGYVDPDYHRCYQLNDKSDVYSFGVVLIELISSKPAVDVTRHRHDINLANMAINRIQSNALHELVDPTLGYQSDPKVTTMVKLVAELAFRCLQDEKEDRPSMEEVLHVLRETEREDYRVEKVVEVDVPAKDDAVLLKKNLPPSPDSVTAAWVSRATTPNTSG